MPEKSESSKNDTRASTENIVILTYPEAFYTH